MTEGRRALLKALGGGAGYIAARIALPALWSSPMIAAMSLPAHAAASNVAGGGGGGGNTTPTGLSCNQETPVGSTEDSNATIAPTISGQTITLDIKPPSQVLSGQKPFVLCEVSTAGTGLAATVIPSTDTGLSGTVRHSLTRAAGTYKFQIRWENGHSAWVTAVVQ